MTDNKLHPIICFGFLSPGTKEDRNDNSNLHPIICLWCHPRSMSTAMERVMRERGDFQCFHEPFMYDYYIHRTVRYMPYFEVDSSAPQSYKDIKHMLLEKAKDSPVFIKDMSYYIVPALFEDEQFARRLTHTFLIRNPLHSILSYFKLDNNVSCEEIGLEAQYRHAQWLQQELAIKPIILVAEQIRENPTTVIEKYWQELGLEFKQDAFQWNTENAPEDWQQVSAWHGNVSQSNQIRKPSQENDEKRRQEFSDLARLHPKLNRYLDHHLAFYEKLKSDAI